jgi:hypothetical protein
MQSCEHVVVDFRNGSYDKVIAQLRGRVHLQVALFFEYPVFFDVGPATEVAERVRTRRYAYAAIRRSLMVQARQQLC